MTHRPWTLAVLGLATWLVACSDAASDRRVWTEEELGEKLFFDTNLSLHRTQSCASCHDPDLAFADGRLGEDGEVRAASLGDDGKSVGDRNAPSAMYAQYSPPFQKGKRERHNTDGDFSVYEGYLGGLFHDGRANDLAAQASGPPLNPAEMGMADEASVVKRLLERAEYESAFSDLYGRDVWDDPEVAYAKMTSAIAAFEETGQFAPFDSRYDRSLLPVGDPERYTYDPASKAAQGKALFFSTEFTNCSACHQLHPQGGASAREEVFSGFEYHNLGIPENVALREMSGAKEDRGLGAILKDEGLDGKFKTPTLRNVGVTAPYMHNGIFGELATVIRFYEHAKRRARDEEDTTENPETGKPWDEPEQPRNSSDLELASGNKDLSDDGNVLALECFLLTLTDSRFEHLLDSAKLSACGI